MRDAHSGLAMLVAIVLCHLDQVTVNNIFDTEAKRRCFNLLEISSGLYATLYAVQSFLDGLMWDMETELYPADKSTKV